ncbi:hypothetical protein GW17_00048705 [Ensete ventricosum]|nr:hypothetical protein GW17_00048705 [Ensete ventricosum]
MKAHHGGTCARVMYIDQRREARYSRIGALVMFLGQRKRRLATMRLEKVVTESCHSRKKRFCHDESKCLSHIAQEKRRPAMIRPRTFMPRHHSEKKSHHKKSKQDHAVRVRKIVSKAYVPGEHNSPDGQLPDR